ncbi:MAG: ATP-binding cassette domain-containing protein [Scrofimicrobium sp.]
MTLEISNLTRKYGERVAVDNVSFEVQDGKLTGFVGANGAGKTTVMRMILGVLTPDAGAVTRDGTALTEAMRRSFGYMPEERGLYPKMKVREQLIYFARLHGLSKDQALGNADRLLDVLGLTERANDPVENLSLGNQQRAQIAVSLVHDPSALVLDEPFSGLDPMAVDVILSVLETNAARGIPILLSSHQLDVVERLCDDIVIIAEGKIAAKGSIAELQKRYSDGLRRLSIRGGVDWLREESGVEVIEASSDEVPGVSATLLRLDEVSYPGLDQHLLRKALGQGEVLAFGPETVRLSAIFKEAVGDDKGGASDASDEGSAR